MKIRPPQDSDDAQIQKQITGTQRDVEAKDVDIRELSEGLAGLLTQPSHTFQPGEAGRVKDAIARTEAERAVLVDRITALERMRAAPEQRAEAGVQVAAMTVHVEEAARLFSAEFAAFMVALESVAEIARRMAATRAEGGSIRWQAADVIARHGLSLPVPAEPAASALDQHIAQLLAKIIADAVSDSPDQQIEYELAAVRRKQAAMEPDPVEVMVTPVEVPTTEVPRTTKETARPKRSSASAAALIAEM